MCSLKVAGDSKQFSGCFNVSYTDKDIEALTWQEKTERSSYMHKIF